MTQRPAAPPAAHAPRRTHAARIEIGWVLAGAFDAVDLDAVQQARTRVLRFLRERFDAFEWRMPVVARREAVPGRTAELVDLLDLGVAERDALQWDAALVVTAAPLESRYKRFALGAPSRAVQTAVLSTARIDPAAALSAADEAERLETMSQRLFALALHLLGHLGGLDHAADPQDLMYDLQAEADLDRMTRFSEEAAAQLRSEWADVADVRLEETGRYRDRTVGFYLRVMWTNQREILRATWQAQPWQFPFRFSKLTTAAVSTLVILVITAEAWDLGMSQPPVFVAALSLAALVGTSAYLLGHQQLIGRRRAQRLSEQRVVSHVAIALAVFLGMATTYLLLFGVTLALGQALFPRALVQSWAASLGGEVTFAHYLTLAGFVAALGIVIGALGASFEEEHYVRHVAYVDEET